MRALAFWWSGMTHRRGELLGELFRVQKCLDEKGHMSQEKRPLVGWVI